MKKLILVAGPPACGKTFVSELIAKNVKHVVYLDKDDLKELLRCSFNLTGERLDMDGKFYVENLRTAEYKTIMDIALSALRFEDLVILNAPFLKEVKDIPYMQKLKNDVQKVKAQLVLIWVVAPLELIYKRMVERNSDRDRLKIANWDEYVKKIEYSTPNDLKDIVDELIVFDTTDELSKANSLEKVIKIIGE